MKMQVCDKIFSKKCLEKSMVINNLNLEEYLMCLNQILNYDDIFNEINIRYQDDIIDKMELEYLSQEKELDIGISLCMIVKDEERCIARNLDNHLPWFDELVIVDTGSKDHTIDIIEKYRIQNNKVKYYTMLWGDDFSEARNFAKNHASKDWILFLDADELIDEKSIQTLYRMAKLFNMFAYKKETAFIINVINLEQDEEITTMQRFFYNNRCFSYYGVVHEYLILNSKVQQYLNIHINIRIKHDGYNKSIIKEKNKCSRNIMLLERMIKTDPGNLRWLYYYTRDGMDLLDNNILISLIKEKLEIRKDEYKENCMYEEYSLELLQNLFTMLLRKNKINECSKILPILEKSLGECYDAVFYKTYLKIMENKNELIALLGKILKYRQSNFSDEYSMISSKGYHIDLLIAMLLYEVGDFKKSKKYFEFLNDKIDFNQPFSNLYFIELLMK